MNQIANDAATLLHEAAIRARAAAGILAAAPRAPKDAALREGAAALRRHAPAILAAVHLDDRGFDGAQLLGVEDAGELAAVCWAGANTVPVGPALMCGAHRSACIAEIKKNLAAGRPTRKPRPMVT